MNLLDTQKVFKMKDNVYILNIYDDYISQLDALLSETNLPLLYYGNPFDWLFMYCTATAQPLDTFQGILAEVLEEADAQ